MIETAAILFTLTVAIATYTLILHRSRTHRARVEQQAKAADAAYKNLFDKAPEPMALVDTSSGTIHQHNLALLQILGLPSEEVQGRLFLDLIHPSSLNQARAAFVELEGSGAIHSADLALRSRTGAPIHVILSASNDPGSGRARITLHDISARKRAEDAIRESEARKAAILESAMDCIITMDHHGLIVDFNPAAERTFGYPRAEVIGKTVAETIVPERMREHHWRGLRRFFETGHGPMLGHRAEIQALRADGSEIPVEISLTSTRSPQGDLFFTAYIRDISDRRRAENAAALLSAIVESSQDAILGMDLTEAITAWNGSAQRLYGYTPEEVLGRPIASLIPPGLRQEQADIFARVRAGERIEQFRTTRICKDGTPLAVSLTVSPIRDSSNRIIGLSTIARPVEPSREVVT